MKRTSTAARAALLCIAGVFATSPAWAALLEPLEVNAIPAAPPNHVIAYGRDSNQFGQLFLPKGRGPHPVAVVIHGGCWKKFADLKNTVPMSDALRNGGLAVWNIEYRRVDSEGGGWPETYLDVARAIDHLRALAPEHHLDLQQVITVGHSAGGHLALWAAARHRLSPTSPLYVANPLAVKGVVDLGGPGRLQSLSAEHQQKVCGSVPIPQLLGGAIDRVPERLRDGSPAELLPLGVPQVLISGSLDWLVPPSFADEYGALAKRSGDEVETMVIEGAGHFELIAPGTAAWPTVAKAVLSLVTLPRRKVKWDT